MKTNWITATASVIGKSHLENDLPCQDASRVKRISCNCGVAIVADGAGSCMYSQLGSKILTVKGVSLFAKKLAKSAFVRRKRVLRKDHWRRIVLGCFNELHNVLAAQTKKNDYNLKDMSSTIIVVAFAPWGLMVAHIGDGRAAYTNSSQEWKPLFTPFSGSEAGTTVFFTSDRVWDQPEIYIETTVVNDSITGFSFLTDGMEKSSFECYIKKPGEERYFDPNMPFANFFNPVANSLQDMSVKGWNQKMINEAWQNFLLHGNDRLVNEPDDKTMIVGILKNSTKWQDH